MAISDFRNWKRTQFSCLKIEYYEKDGSRYIFTHYLSKFLQRHLNPILWIILFIILVYLLSNFVHLKLLTSIMTTRTYIVFRLFISFLNVLIPCTPSNVSSYWFFSNPALFLANYVFEVVWVSFRIHFHIQTGTDPDFFKRGEKRRLLRKIIDKNVLIHVINVYTYINQTNIRLFPSFFLLFFFGLVLLLFFTFENF